MPTAARRRFQSSAARAGTRSRRAPAAPPRGLAGELLNLYAERKRRRGHAFPEFSEELRDLEAELPYRETPDQRDAIENVIADMETERPMDRLICGDVGYGKTEVALRAAVKAASDGKQVMMLVPTTILAQQHYGTFAERLRDQPFEIEHVSRFRTPADQRDAVKRFTEGRVDILIGTHRLLSRDVRAKDLGLMVVDEEQRFGVRQKELLRQLRIEVDVLSMCATPIPRTLQMSLAGLRDISVIETPPGGRQPIRTTYVSEYDETLVAAAGAPRSRARGRRSSSTIASTTIDEAAERLRSLCPRLRVAVAHGQMDEKQLEERMVEFLRGELTYSSPPGSSRAGSTSRRSTRSSSSAPTCSGSAQLYQIRGRVGPWRERRARVPHVPGRERALGGGAGAPGRARDYTRARLGLPRRAARSRAARRRQPARRRAVRARRGRRLRALTRSMPARRRSPS